MSNSKCDSVLEGRIFIDLEKKGYVRLKRWLFMFVTITVLWIYIIYQSLLPSLTHPISHSSTLTAFASCSINTYLSTSLPWLKTAAPLPPEEFLSRREKTAKALASDDIDALTLEPGYAFQYYANISQKDWEPWEQEERPFLMIIQKHKNENGKIKAKTKFLAPKFEVERVKLLGMPIEKSTEREGEEENLDIIPWEEHWNPYTTLLTNWNFTSNHHPGPNATPPKPKIMVDDEMRDFIQRGLSEAGFEVVGLSGEVEQVRQIKTEREIGILRAVNTGTVEAIRCMRACMVPGLTETQVMNVLDDTLRAGGLEPFFDLVLFDEDASNPHGGTDGEKILEPETFVLIDVGAHLHGYSSDISRTFFPPFLPQPHSHSPTLLKKRTLFTLVHAAQTATLHTLTSAHTAADVDLAARAVLAAAGYEAAFTHRVGHGIGIKAHESPYLHRGNNGTRLRAGMVFTSEPGVYLVGEFGVRLEDVMLVTGEGEPDVLSGRRAMGPWDP